MSSATKQQAARTQEKVPAGQSLLEQVIEYTPYGEPTPVKLTRSFVRQTWAHPTKSGKECPDYIIDQFMMLCKMRGLNPWLSDCFVVGYDGSDGPSWSVQTAYQALSKRAEDHPQYDGTESGIIVVVDGKKEIREGACRQSHETLIGAWARAHRKDRKIQAYAEVNRDGFDKKRSTWKSMPDEMLVKCAKAAAKREAFPKELAGLYIKEEFELAAMENEPTQREPERKQSVTAGDLLKPAAKAKSETEIKLFEKYCTGLETLPEVQERRDQVLAICEDQDQRDMVDLIANRRMKQIEEAAKPQMSQEELFAMDEREAIQREQG